MTKFYITKRNIKQDFKKNHNYENLTLLLKDIHEILLRKHKKAFRLSEGLKKIFDSEISQLT